MAKNVRSVRTIGLAEALDPDVLRAYGQKATGDKYLIDPRRDERVGRFP